MGLSPSSLMTARAKDELVAMLKDPGSNCSSVYLKVSKAVWYAGQSMLWVKSGDLMSPEKLMSRTSKEENHVSN